MSTPAFPHGALQAQIARMLGNICEQSFPHLLAASHTGFILTEDTEQSPDVLLIDREVYRSLEVYRGALRGHPDLAVEIVSPSESAADVEEKVDVYLTSGTKTVWVVWPRTKRITVYHWTGEVAKVGPGQFVDAPEVLPGVQIPVNSLFPEL